MKKLFLVPFALLAAAPACSVDHDTQVTVAIASEAKIPSEVNQIHVEVRTASTNALRFEQDYTPDSGADFPTTLAVIPADEDSLKNPIQVFIHATGPGGIDLQRTAVVSYVEGRNLLLAMPLRMACLEFGDCGAGQTCAGGQCVAQKVDSAALPTFAESLVSATTNCFDETACLANKVLADVAEDCTFPITGDPAQLNVAIRWAAAPDRLLALDSGDKVEGWTVDAPGKAKLSPGVCNSHLQKAGPDGRKVFDVAKQVYVTTGCAAKTNLTPYCKSTTTQVGVGAAVPE